MVDTLSSVSVKFVVNASFLVMLLLFLRISSSQNLVALSLLSSVLTFLNFFEDLNLYNDVLIGFLFACKPAIDMHKNKFLSGLIFFVR